MLTIAEFMARCAPSLDQELEAHAIHLKRVEEAKAELPYHDPLQIG